MSSIRYRTRGIGLQRSSFFQCWHSNQSLQWKRSKDKRCQGTLYCNNKVNVVSLVSSLDSCIPSLMARLLCCLATRNEFTRRWLWRWHFARDFDGDDALPSVFVAGGICCTQNNAVARRPTHLFTATSRTLWFRVTDSAEKEFIIWFYVSTL